MSREPTTEDWVEAVQAGDTLLGYFEWSRQEQENNANTQWQEDRDKAAGIVAANPVLMEPDFAARLARWEADQAALRRGQDFVDQQQDRDFHDEEEF